MWFQCAPKVETHHQHWPAEHLLALNSVRQFVGNTDSCVSPPEMWFTQSATEHRDHHSIFFSPSKLFKELVWLGLDATRVWQCGRFISVHFCQLVRCLHSSFLIHSLPIFEPLLRWPTQDMLLASQESVKSQGESHEQSVAVQYRKSRGLR